MVCFFSWLLLFLGVWNKLNRKYEHDDIFHFKSISAKMRDFYQDILLFHFLCHIWRRELGKFLGYWFFSKRSIYEFMTSKSNLSKSLRFFVEFSGVKMLFTLSGMLVFIVCNYFNVWQKNEKDNNSFSWSFNKLIPTSAYEPSSLSGQWNGSSKKIRSSE